MSVLDALFAVQREQDRTLSFRYSCRLGMCGTCPVIVNDREVLACQTLVERLPGDTDHPAPPQPPAGGQGPGGGPRAVLRPLPPGQAPLRPRRQETPPDGASPAGADAGTQVIRQGEGARRWVDPALGCITCAICHSACSVVGLNERLPRPGAPQPRLHPDQRRARRGPGGAPRGRRRAGRRLALPPALQLRQRLPPPHRAHAGHPPAAPGRRERGPARPPPPALAPRARPAPWPSSRVPGMADAPSKQIPRE